MGDKFSDITNSTIVSKSVVMGAVQNLQSRNRDDEAELLKQLALVVEESGSQEAGDLLEGFSTELAKPEPNKNLLRTIWTGIQSALPGAMKMVELAEGVEKLIN
jgi:hypothetical protein